MSQEEENNQAASELLSGVVRKNRADYISFSEIKLALHERGFGLLMLVFALPTSIPLPVPPGFTLLPAIPLLFFSVQMIMGMDSPWLPQWVGRKKIKRTTLALMIEKAAPYLHKVERLLRPRFSFATSPLGEKIVGIFCLICSLSIAIPVPLTNFIPAAGISLMSLGLLSKDGILTIFGMAVGTFGVCVALSVIFIGPKIVMGWFF